MKCAKSKRIWLSLSWILILAVVLCPLAAPAQDAHKNTADLESCTSIMVGRLASVDGSVMTAHSCDGNYRSWANIVPRGKYNQGAKKKIAWGTLHTDTPWDLKGVIQKGEIPEVETTYSYLNVAYPCLNEKQLAIGETTIGGREELRNDEGLFLIEELEKIVLERCTSAREAILLIGQLVKEYGYGDWGECLTFADPKGVWHFEIFGAGPAEKGAVWAAVRIPDDQVGVSANIPRIGELNLKDASNCLASDNVFSVAEAMGWWDPKGKEPFKFWKAYSGRKPFSMREFYVLSTMAPSLNLKMEMEELPFTVKPEKKVAVRDLFKYYRETYEGTPWDMTKNLLVPKSQPFRRGEPEKKDQPVEIVKSPIANPWMGGDFINLVNTLKPGTIERQRTIAISACSYSHVIQCRGWLPDGLGGIAWFSYDNPGQSPRIPIFAGVLELPRSFEIGNQERFRSDSASWAFRRANRLATIRWGVTRKQIEDGVREFEDKAFDDLPWVEKKALELFQGEKGEKDPQKYRQYLTKYTGDFARAAIDKWQELGDIFWGLFARGF